MERISDIIDLDTSNNSKNFSTIESNRSDNISINTNASLSYLPSGLADNSNSSYALTLMEGGDELKTELKSESKEDSLFLSDPLSSPDSYFCPERIMSEVMKELRQVMNEKIFSTWFSALKLISIEPVLSEGGGHLNIAIGCPNKFSQDHLKRQYSVQLETSFKKVIRSEVVIRFEVDKEAENTRINKISIGDKTISNKANATAGLSTNSKLSLTATSGAYKSGNAQSRTNKAGTGQTAKQVSDESNLNFNYNFSNFVIGTCNQFAQAACLKVSESPGAAYNPLLIYGGVGLGKTHLANAIGNAARRRNKKVYLASSERFVSELITSLKSNSMDKFKAKFRTLDVLIIDDIQFIIGKERTQEEFFHTFNELYGKQKQIIITSDKLPQELVGLEERLRTRFSSGLSVDLQVPDFETRIAILIKKAESFGLKLSHSVAKIIAERINTNVRELEGALTRLQALCSLFSQEPSEDLALKVVDTISPLKSKELSTDSIKEAVARQFNVSINDLSGKRRTQNIALARQVAMYLCRKHVSRSFPEIGALFGGRDHSTVIHAIKTMNDRMIADESLNKHIQLITESLHRS